MTNKPKYVATHMNGDVWGVTFAADPHAWLVTQRPPLGPGRSSSTSSLTYSLLRRSSRAHFSGGSTMTFGEPTSSSRWLVRASE